MHAFILPVVQMFEDVSLNIGITLIHVIQFPVARL
jgi:hypothetical protein